MAIASKQKTRHAGTHKKRTGQHQKRTQRFMKTYWPYIPMAGIIGIGLLINTAISAHPTSQVLAYATEMSTSNLFDGTNNQRVSNGEAGLRLNGQLMNAAQAKANDMAARNYWSHNTPDGQPPWVFFTQAGYNYRAAGENLAYGFDSSAATIDGWMNSPGHRANILNGGFQDVGFGIANSSNYQNNGPETIVVAEYGTPAGSPAPATARPAVPSRPKSTVPTPKPTLQPSTTPAPSTTQPTAIPVPASVATTQPANTNPQVKIARVAEPPSKRVARIQVLTQGYATWSLFALSSLGVVSIFLILAKHTYRWQKALIHSEEFVLHHIHIDLIVLVIIVVSYILTRSVGVIR